MISSGTLANPTFRKESFKQRYNITNICKNGGIINRPILSIVLTAISLLIAYVTYCVLPRKLKIIFVVLYSIGLAIGLYDLIHLFILSNKKIEQKCINLITKKSRSSGLWKLWNVVSAILGFIMVISLIYFIVRYVFYGKNSCKE